MEIIYYTIAAVILYELSDYILNKIEIKMGKRLPQRSFYFLIIITVLSLVSFSVIRTAFYQPQTTQQTVNTPIKQDNKEPVSPTPIQTPPAKETGK
jgi:predicted PurR-regulated permease PerM